MVGLFKITYIVPIIVRPAFKYSPVSKKGGETREILMRGYFFGPSFFAVKVSYTLRDGRYKFTFSILES